MDIVPSAPSVAVRLQQSWQMQQQTSKMSAHALHDNPQDLSSSNQALSLADPCHLPLGSLSAETKIRRTTRYTMTTICMWHNSKRICTQIQPADAATVTQVKLKKPFKSQPVMAYITRTTTVCKGLQCTGLDFRSYLAWCDEQASYVLEAAWKGQCAPESAVGHPISCARA